ncbi:hypothetical protein D7Y13_11820 [Corallococcus praedator]|uniref:Lipoprotein n=1 Tax=Corallococcus praedator TaxID=2316724 RepID=A0ABX9QL68_9BACT|nr:hypothetical protein D7X75_07830 [Corallococcus sp. CA031C]RKI11009.1 hypothetical protein D7Y13_11820 [Corallococcus praedator]
MKSVLAGVAFSFSVVACGPVPEQPQEAELGTREDAVCRTGSVKCVSLNLTWFYESGCIPPTYPPRPDALVECDEWCPDNESCVDNGYN